MEQGWAVLLPIIYTIYIHTYKMVVVVVVVVSLLALKPHMRIPFRQRVGM